MPQRPAGPPDVPTRLESREGPLPGGHGFPEVTGNDVHLTQTGLSEGSDIVEAAHVSDRCGLAAVGNSHFWPTSGQAVEEAHPVVSGGPAARVSDFAHQGADAIEGFNMLYMSAQSKLDLTLLQHSVDL